MLTLKNLKGQLYSREYLEEVVSDCSQRRRLNSFVRPKLEVEFFEINDIGTADLQASLAYQDNDTVIMMGGYGENFMFPHSLLTYFYHILKFHKVDRELKTIEKRNILEKPLTINLKDFVKPKNVFQDFNIFENGSVTQNLTR